MFRGRHDHTIDKKGRLSIPSGFRMEIQRRSEKPPVLTRETNHLLLFPYDEWMEFEDYMNQADPMDIPNQRRNRFYRVNATDAPIDSQGRILIPKHLRDGVNLERDVTVTGMGPKIEIWDTAALDDEMNQIYETLHSQREQAEGAT